MLKATYGEFASCELRVLHAARSSFSLFFGVARVVQVDGGDAALALRAHLVPLAELRVVVGPRTRRALAREDLGEIQRLLRKLDAIARSVAIVAGLELERAGAQQFRHQTRTEIERAERLPKLATLDALGILEVGSLGVCVAHHVPDDGLRLAERDEFLAQTVVVLLLGADRCDELLDVALRFVVECFQHLVGVDEGLTKGGDDGIRTVKGQLLVPSVGRTESRRWGFVVL